MPPEATDRSRLRARRRGHSPIPRLGRKRRFDATCRTTPRVAPGPVITNHYRFKDANGSSELHLVDLFGDHEALVTYFWMYGPQRERPYPMCTNWLGAVNGNAADIKQQVALKILGRSTVERQLAFATERGWRHLDFVQTVGDDYANDLGLINPDGSEILRRRCSNVTATRCGFSGRVR